MSVTGDSERDLRAPPRPEDLPASSPAASPGPGGRLVAALQRLLLPAACLACDRPLGAGRHPFGLCLPCRGRLRPPAPGCAVCGAPLPAARARPLAEGFACARCRSDPPAFERLVAPWRYDGPAEAVVRGLKYRRLDYLGEHLAGHLARELTRELAREAKEHLPAHPAGEGSAAWDLVVPVPLHWRRRWRRGYNQAERIARPLARRLGIRYADLLRRVRATRPQARLERAERLLNPRGAFALRRLPVLPRRRPAPEGLRVLLVDDVATTGATLDAAAGVLVAAGAARVVAVAAARTPEPR